MPRFERVEALGAPSVPAVVAPSPRALGAGVGQSLARLGGALTEFGVERERQETALRRERQATEAEIAIGRQLLDAKDSLRRETDPDRLREMRETLTRDLESSVSSVKDRVVQETIRRRVGAHVLAFEADVADRTFTLELSRNRAATEVFVTERERLAVSDPNPATRALAQGEIDQRISEAVLSGTYTAEEGVARRAKAVRTVTAGRVEAAILANPTAALAALVVPDAGLAVGLAEDERLKAVEQARTLERQRISEALAVEKQIDDRLEKARREREEVLEREYLTAFAAGTPPPLTQLLTDLRSGAFQGEAARRMVNLYEMARKEPRKSDPDVLGQLEYQIATGDPLRVADIQRHIGPEGLTFTDAAKLVKALEARKDFEGDPQYQMGKTVLDVLRPSEFTATPEQRVFYANALSEWQLAWRAGRRGLPEAETIRDRYVAAMRRSRMITRGLELAPAKYPTPQAAVEAFQRREISEEEFNLEVERFRRDAEAEALGERRREGRRGPAEEATR